MAHIKSSTFKKSCKKSVPTYIKPESGSAPIVHLPTRLYSLNSSGRRSVRNEFARNARTGNARAKNLPRRMRGRMIEDVKGWRHKMPNDGLGNSRVGKVRLYIYSSWNLREVNAHERVKGASKTQLDWWINGCIQSLLRFRSSSQTETLSGSRKFSITQL